MFCKIDLVTKKRCYNCKKRVFSGGYAWIFTRLHFVCEECGKQYATND